MSWRLVARKDFEDVIRSWMFWTIIGVSLLLMVIVTFGVATGDMNQIGQNLVYVLFNSLGSQLVIPIMALIFGYMAIAGERQSGSLRILFGLSHNRWDVMVGKLLSRSGVMVIGTLLSCAVVGALIVMLFDSFEVGTFLTFVVLTTLLALTFTGIAIGISSTTGTRARAMGGAIGSYVGFMLLWHPFVAILHYVIEGELVGLEAPNWYLGLLAVNPLTAYRETLGQQLDQYLSALIGWPNIVEDVPPSAMAEEGTLLLTNRASDAPFYLTDWFAVAVLLAWFAVPVALGYWRFQKADLN